MEELLRLIMGSGILNENPNAFTPQAQQNIQSTYGVNSPMNIASGIPNTPMRPSQSIIETSGSLIPNFITNMFNPNTYTVDGVTATQVDNIPLDPASLADTATKGINPLTLLTVGKALQGMGTPKFQPVPPMDTRVRQGGILNSDNLYADYQDEDLGSMGRML